MNEHVETLKRHIAENPPNYGSDAHSILEMLMEKRLIFLYYFRRRRNENDFN